MHGSYALTGITSWKVHQYAEKWGILEVGMDVLLDAGVHEVELGDVGQGAARHLHL